MSGPTSPKCPSFEMLSHAFSEGLPESLAPHVNGCESCQKVWSEFESIKSAAQALPWDVASPEQVASSKAQLLLAARYVGPKPGPWPAVAAVSTAVAVAATALLVLRSPSPVETNTPESEPVRTDFAPAPTPTGARRAILRAEATAKVEHYARQDTEANEREELVRVTNGTLRVDLEPLAEAERFRLITIDAELESRAAVFDVQVEDQHLQAVWVTSGVVELRPSEGVPRILRTGDRWDAPFRPSREPPAPAVEKPRVVAVERSSEPTEPEIPPPTGEALFTLGFDAFERGEHRAAEQHLGRLLETSPEHPLAEDAAYWRALALAKLDDPQAEPALAHFIESSGSVERTERLALILGLRQVARGARDEGIQSLRRAEASSSIDIRERARTALSSLGSD